MSRGFSGAIAQLGERLNGIQEVGGSTPPGSTNLLAFRAYDDRPIEAGVAAN
jgi:hypothetical protein